MVPLTAMGLLLQMDVSLLFSALMVLAQVSPADPHNGELEPTTAAGDLRGEGSNGAPPAPPAIILRKGERIMITVDDSVGSKISMTGDMFPIRLARSIEVDGVEVVPAGVSGKGQVVHAKKGGMGGAAGELVLAARHLDYGGRRIELRSFGFVEEGDEILSRGEDNVGLANTIGAAPYVGVISFFISGGNTTIEPGTLATAKIRNDEVFFVQHAVPDNQGQ
jgi:hypothetical protein